MSSPVHNIFPNITFGNTHYTLLLTRPHAYSHSLSWILSLSPLNSHPPVPCHPPPPLPGGAAFFGTPFYCAFPHFSVGILPPPPILVSRGLSSSRCDFEKRIFSAVYFSTPAILPARLGAGPAVTIVARGRQAPPRRPFGALDPVYIVSK